MGWSAGPVQVGPAQAVRLASEANPLAGWPFYVNPTSKARVAADGANPPSPDLDAIANTPTEGGFWREPSTNLNHAEAHADTLRR